MIKVVRNSKSYQKLVMFDFDDTLASTEECTLVRSKKTDRIVDHLSGQQEYDEYELSDKHYFDFSEFNTVSDFAEPIESTLDIMREFLEDPTVKVIVLTARQGQSAPSITKFLEEQGINTKQVPVYGSSGSANKAAMLQKLIKKFSITREVLVFEDSLSNISDIIRLEYVFPDLSFAYVQVIDAENSDEDLEEAKKYRYPKGEYGTEKYQRILKRIHPAMKRRLLGLGGNDYLDKGVSKVKDFKRSKSAPPSG